MAGRLAAGGDGSAPYAFLFLGLLAIQGAVLRAPERWRLLAVPFALQASYFLMGPAMRALHAEPADAILRAVDERFLGVTPSLVAERFVHPALTDLMSACYMLFFPYLIVSHVHYFRGDPATLRKFCVGLYSVYAAGLIGYALLPAAGPYVAMAGEFRGPVDGGALTRIHQAIVVRGTNGVDVFPSLHCAVTGFLLFFDRRHAPRRFGALILPVAVLWCSTIYLRYHYAVDVAAGFALAGLGLRLSAVDQTSLKR